jgi:hypothetical protein
VSRRRVIPGLLLLALLATVIFLLREWQRPGQLSLKFYAVAGDQRLVMDKLRYANPGGAGRFKVRDFQFFISNIRLQGEAGEYRVPGSYHLARFDNRDGVYEIVLENIPRREYERIEFGIGVDAEANASLVSVGELDPNGRMAWNWEVGYKFLLFEGGLLIDEIQLPLVYHLGFDENYSSLGFDVGRLLLEQREDVIEWRVDVLALFDGQRTWDLAATPSVKFDRSDARALTGNIPAMVRLCTMSCAP